MRYNGIDNQEIINRLNQPAMQTTGYTDSVVDETVVELYQFYQIKGDGESTVDLERTVEYNQDGILLSTSEYSLVNLPTIDSVTTDHTDPTKIPLNVQTELTIAGTRFGADDDHITVSLSYPAYGKLSPMAANAIFRVGPSIVSSEDPDDAADAELVVSVLISETDRNKPGTTGDAYLTVHNHKRGLISEPFRIEVVK